MSIFYLPFGLATQPGEMATATLTLPSGEKQTFGSPKATTDSAQWTEIISSTASVQAEVNAALTKIIEAAGEAGTRSF